MNELLTIPEILELNLPFPIYLTNTSGDNIIVYGHCCDECSESCLKLTNLSLTPPYEFDHFANMNEQFKINYDKRFVLEFDEIMK